MENNYSMLVIWLFPLLGGIIGFYLGKKNKTSRNDWLDIILFVECIMLGCMGYQIASDWSTLSMGLEDVFGLGLFFKMDIVRLVLCVTVTIVFAVVLQFMKESMKEEKGSNRFYLLYMGEYSMILGAIMTPNLFNLFMFVTAALLLAYPMMIHRQDSLAVRNANIYLTIVMITIVVFLISIVLLLGYIGSLEVDVMAIAVAVNGTTPQALVAGYLAFVVFAVYAGLFPGQFLVTRGSSFGLMEISVVLTSVVSKLGVYGIMLLACTVFGGNQIFGRTLLGISILATIWGLLITFSSTNIRKILMGLNVAVNGFNTLGIALMVLAGASNTYTVRGSLYMLLASSLSLMVLYMVALELVRKMKTFEIKGLIASGKGNVWLMVGCFVACASLLGLPGTAGYLSFSLIYKTILTTVGWRWLVVLFVIMWAAFMTAVSRVFMKFFVSKKDETVLILSTEEELRGNVDEDLENEECSEKNPYHFAEVLLIVVGVVQVLIGVLPKFTIDTLSNAIDTFFFSGEVLDSITYYTMDGIIAFVVAAIIATILYVNLVHGILLRAIRNKKNKELKDRME